MPNRFARELAFRADLVRLLAEADALGLQDVAIDLDHARVRLDGCPGEAAIALAMAEAMA